jgi:hypothetical protein
MADIFISYSTSDEAFTRRLYREFERFNVHGFMDISDFAMGSEWSTRLKETVKNADAVVVILSKSSAQSSLVMAEIGLANSFGKLVIPVLAPGEKYEQAVPPLLLDRIVIDANRLELVEVAAQVVAAITNIPLELALHQVRRRARRRQVLLIAILLALVVLSASSTIAAFFAYKQREVAVKQMEVAELARAEAERVRKRIQELTGQSGALAIAPDGNTVATGSRDGGVALWDTKSGRLLKSLTGHEGVVSALAFSTDGRLLAVASWDHTVTIWDAATGMLLLRLEGHTDAVTSVQFSPDGQLLYSRSVDGTIREWNVANGLVVRIFQAPA